MLGDDPGPGTLLGIIAAFINTLYLRKCNNVLTSRTRH